jgi:hypothetical protein
MGICPNVNVIQFLLRNDILEQKLDIWLKGLVFRVRLRIFFLRMIQP